MYGSKKGLTLVEVMLATVIIGIVAGLAGAYIVSVHRERMDSRLWRAAALQADSAMEAAFYAVGQFRGQINDECYLSISNNIYNIVSSDPGLQWEYDDEWRDYQIYLDGRNTPVTMRVRVTHVNDRVIEIYSERYKNEHVE